NTMIAIINNTVINLTIGLLNFNFILLVLLLWTSVRGGKFNMSMTGSSGSSVSSTFSFVSLFSTLLTSSNNVFKSSSASFIFITSYFKFNYKTYYKINYIICCYFYIMIIILLI